MATVKQEAEAYEPATNTKNVSELPVLLLEQEMFDFTGTNKEGKEYKYKYVEVNGERYRVPYSVLDEIKTQLKELGNFDRVRVLKRGSGVETRYTVLPLGVSEELVK